MVSIRLCSELAIHSSSRETKPSLRMLFGTGPRTFRSAIRSTTAKRIIEAHYSTRRDASFTPNSFGSSSQRFQACPSVATSLRHLRISASEKRNCCHGNKAYSAARNLATTAPLLNSSRSLPLTWKPSTEDMVFEKLVSNSISEEGPAILVLINSPNVTLSPTKA